MILNKGGPKKRNPDAAVNYFTQQNGVNQSNPSPTTNLNFGESDAFFNEQQYQQQQYNQPASNNFYKPSQHVNQNNGYYEQPRSHSPQVYNPYNNNGSGANFNGNGGYNNVPPVAAPAYNPNQHHQAQFQPQQNNKYNQPPMGQQQPPFFNPLQTPANLFNDPVASMAVKYGANLADQGKEYVAQNVDKWFSISQLKYYFAVDTNYVAKKLLLLLFPFFNRDWTLKYSQADGTSPVPPKLDVNAPDMYIPVMAFVTYILIVGVSLGMQNKFSPEQLGMQASSALGWLVIECLVIFILLQVLAIKSALKTFDIISFCGYKYYGMILCLAGSLLMPNFYYLVLLYVSAAFTYFMVRTLKVIVLSGGANGAAGSGEESTPPSYDMSHAGAGGVGGYKRRVYVLLFISLLQPVFMWWLTRHLVA